MRGVRGLRGSSLERLKSLITLCVGIAQRVVCLLYRPSPKFRYVVATTATEDKSAGSIQEQRKLQPLDLGLSNYAEHFLISYDSEMELSHRQIDLRTLLHDHILA